MPFAAVPGLNRNYAHSLPVLIPPKEIGGQFEDYAQRLYHQINVLEQMNRRLREARDLLLPRLMSGQITF